MRHGAPSEIISDQETPFFASVTREVLEICQTPHVNKIVHNPACDELTETFNKVLAVMVSMYVDDFQRDWDEHLPLLTSAYITSKQASTGYTPFFLLYERKCCSALDVALGALPAHKLSDITDRTEP